MNNETLAYLIEQVMKQRNMTRAEAIDFIYTVFVK